eukprot:TRINITY_DN654_c0_g1_i1.p1 TRINITY_DN654_c0_g1~~TRINITY_DN654_c0_g1_i1.p1  ORF type:complete len:422 (-),score=117.16 TRINITY_DN654_c0_g1_i1:2008-3273(-)
MSVLVADKGVPHRPVAHIPHLDDVVLGARDQRLPVGRKADGAHVAVGAAAARPIIVAAAAARPPNPILPIKGGHPLPRRRLKDVGAPVGAGRQVLAVETVAHAANHRVVHKGVVQRHGHVAIRPVGPLPLVHHIIVFGGVGAIDERPRARHPIHRRPAAAGVDFGLDAPAVADAAAVERHPPPRRAARIRQQPPDAAGAADARQVWVRRRRAAAASAAAAADDGEAGEATRRAAAGPLHARSRADDVVAMQARGASTMLFKYVYIGEVQLTASYKSKETDAKGLLDFRDLTVRAPSQMYSSQLWTWKLFFNRVKQDMIFTVAKRAASNYTKLKLFGIRGTRDRMLSGAEAVVESLFTKIGRSPRPAAPDASSGGTMTGGGASPGGAATVWAAAGGGPGGSRSVVLMNEYRRLHELCVAMDV